MRGLLVFGFILIAMAGSHAHAGYTCNIQYGGTVNVPCDTGGETAACSYVENTVADWSCGQGEQWVHSLTGTSGTISGPGPGSITCTIPYTPPAGGTCGGGGTWVPQINFVSDGCAAGEVFNSQTQQCEPEPSPCDLGFTITQQGTGTSPATVCNASCVYVPNGPQVTFGDNSWIREYTTNGNQCTADNSNPLPDPSLNDQPNPFPDNEQPPVADDGDTNNDPATDENQETMSRQLQGIQGQLSDIGQGMNNLDSNTNGVESLLSQILAQGQGTGTGGPGTGDQDGDGTDDSFTDGGCSGPPACNGPAIECAIAAQAYLTRCNLQDDTSDITEAEIQSQVGTTETLEEYFDETKPENIVDIDGIFVAPTETTGSCPGDYSVTTSLGTISFTWSYVCDLGTLVRPVMILLSWVMVAFMFYSTLLRDW